MGSDRAIHTKPVVSKHDENPMFVWSFLLQVTLEQESFPDQLFLKEPAHAPAITMLLSHQKGRILAALATVIPSSLSSRRAVGSSHSPCCLQPRLSPLELNLGTDRPPGDLTRCGTVTVCYSVASWYGEEGV